MEKIGRRKHMSSILSGPTCIHMCRHMNIYTYIQFTHTKCTHEREREMERERKRERERERER